MTTEILGILSVTGYVLTFALIPWLLLDARKPAVSTVAWILAIVTLPYLGAVLYLIFGINRVARRAARQQSTSRIGHQLPTVSEYQVLSTEGLPEHVRSLVRLAGRIGGTRPTSGNDIDISASTPKTFEWLEEAIRQAEATIHLEYYIWQPDATGRSLRDLLIERARAGVKIRFLYDSLGSIRLGRRFLQPMIDAGIEVATFLPGQSFRERWSINLRSHRKIVVVDGQVGFTGGMNIGDEYLGKNKVFGYWRDTHLRLRGPAVLQLQQVFVEDWYFATGEALTSPEYFPPPNHLGDETAQVIAGGPDGDVDVLHILYFAAINAARTELTLATSYFVPTESLATALEAAARRGVEVRLLLAGRSAHPATLLAARSYYASLLAAGVKIFEYREGLLHSKTLTIDGSWSIIGSANFDPRSLILNFEVGVILHDRRVALQLAEHFQNDLQRAVEIHLEEWEQRSRVRKLAENICRLFSPVL